MKELSDEQLKKIKQKVKIKFMLYKFKNKYGKFFIAFLLGWVLADIIKAIL